LNNIGADGKLNKKFSKSNMNKLKEQDKMPSFTELNIWNWFIIINECNV